MSKVTFFSSEHVSPGHPDKVMDAVAESVVDYVLENGRKGSRVAVDGVVKNEHVVLAGEITTNFKIPFEDITRETVKEIGYVKEKSEAFNDEDLKLTTIFTEQSAHIAQGVDHNSECEAAGDIGIMFGGAVNEAPDYTCWSHYLSRLLSYNIYKAHLHEHWMRPDQKTQVTIEYHDNVPVRISDIVVCVSHSEVVDLNYIKEDIKKRVHSILCSVDFPENFDWDTYELHVNPTGAFAIFGPVSDSGEVGRKIVCDQYGGFFPVGGGNLNGKDATKVDRSAVYMARYVAKLIVANHMADKCCIQVSYAIGQIAPISIHVECYGTNKISMDEIYNYVSTFSFAPGDIIRLFKLDKSVDEGRTFQYKKLGMYGHIGNPMDSTQVLPWENV